MAQISIADDLLEKIDSARPESVSAEEFVADAVREKLAWQDKKTEFFELSDETRRMMDAKGIAEAEILADFEGSREGLVSD
jgi:hypothetical protein